MNIRSALIVFLTIFSITTANSIFACAQHLPTDVEKMQTEKITFNFTEQFFDLFSPETNSISTMPYYNSIAAALRNAVPILIWGVCQSSDSVFFIDIRQLFLNLDKAPVDFINLGHIITLHAMLLTLETFLLVRSLASYEEDFIRPYNEAPEHKYASLKVYADGQGAEQWSEKNRFEFPWKVLINHIRCGLLELIDVIHNLEFLINKQLPAEQIVKLLHKNPNVPTNLFVAKVESASFLGL
ncbi:MAG: hypothetical protein US49_C0014G0016 [candidate division TM6 bacterium GW2011_GWF2_37_49]|nr:MAG: hypothetical protein US49_C0014G0016 [candidate division TM6 bacterium GW2011_GWF2_37_49]